MPSSESRVGVSREPDVDYTRVTEATGNRVTREAVSMLYTRYTFAAGFCEDRRVLEVACGTGQGLGHLAKRGKTVVGGDYTGSLIMEAQRHYRGRVPLLRLDAHTLPFRASRFDVVVLYEALYYLTEPDRFLGECTRVLARPGTLLICTVNKEWSGFNPSPFSTRYFSAGELLDLLERHGFVPELYGAFPVATDSVRDRVVALIRRMAVATHLVPRTMKGKEWLKRLFLGPLVSLPSEVTESMAPYCAPSRIAGSSPPPFKVLFAVAHTP